MPDIWKESLFSFTGAAVSVDESCLKGSLTGYKDTDCILTSSGLAGSVPTDGSAGWTCWTEWTTCSQPCNSGTRSRQRTCVPDPTSNPGPLDCTGNPVETLACTGGSCEASHCPPGFELTIKYSNLQYVKLSWHSVSIFQFQWCLLSCWT